MAAERAIYAAPHEEPEVVADAIVKATIAWSRYVDYLFTAIRVTAAAIPPAAVRARIGAMITAIDLGAS
jgi:hypothetical protein